MSDQGLDVLSRAISELGKDVTVIGTMLVKASYENAKLRQLCRWLIEYCKDLDSCEGCECVHDCESEENTDGYGFPIACVAYDRIVAEARELGLEVPS